MSKNKNNKIKIKNKSNKKINIFLLLILLLNLNNCRWITDYRTPFMMGFKISTPTGTPSFKKGFNDGCNTIIYGRSNVFYRMFHKHNIDPKLYGTDSAYTFGYKRGYGYCFQNRPYQFGGGVDTVISGNPPFTQGMGVPVGGIDSILGGSSSGNNWLDGGGSLDDMMGAVMKPGAPSGALGGAMMWNSNNSGSIFGNP